MKVGFCQKEKNILLKSYLINYKSTPQFPFCFSSLLRLHRVHSTSPAHRNQLSVWLSVSIVSKLLGRRQSSTNVEKVKNETLSTQIAREGHKLKNRYFNEIFFDTAWTLRMNVKVPHCNNFEPLLSHWETEAKTVFHENFLSH